MMLVFSEIPTAYQAELLTIERRSNPYAWSDENLLSSYQHYQHLGAFLGRQLVAYIFFRVVANEAEVIHLVCDQAHQGKGYANRLFTRLIDEQAKQGINTWHLEVRSTNEKAKKLYQQLGFKTVGQRQSYYQGQEDAILMRLDTGV